MSQRLVLDPAADLVESGVSAAARHGTGQRPGGRGAPQRRRQPCMGLRGPGTAQRTPPSHRAGCRSSHRVGPSAVRPGTMSSIWPRPTSTMPVAQARLAKRPRRQNRVSSRPSASVWAIRPVSASSSAWPQRRTDALTVCHPQPSAAAMSPIGSPRPARRVAHRAARAVSSARPGAISESCSVNDGAPQPARGHLHRRLLHQPGGPAERRQDLPAPPGARLWTTAARHSAHSPVSAPRGGCAPAEARPSGRQRRAPPRLRVPRSTRRRA